MGVEVALYNYGSSSPQGLQNDRVLCNAVWPVDTNNSKGPVPKLKVQGKDPLIHWSELQRMVAELESYD